MAARTEIEAALIDRLWAQWTAIGVDAHAPAEIDTVDPEALIAATSFVGDADVRLLEVALGWTAAYGDFLNTARLKKIGRELGVSELAAWSSFMSILQGSDLQGSTRSRAGAVRIRHDFTAGSTAVLRMRAFCGVNARADVLAFLLTHPDLQPSVTDLARRLRFARGAVAQAVRGLTLSGALRASDGALELVDRAALASAFGPVEAGEGSWVDTFGVTLAVLRFLADTMEPSGVAFDRLSRVITPIARRTDLPDPPSAAGADVERAVTRWTDDLAARLKLGRLFSSRIRSDPSPHRPSETLFHFLDRAAGSVWDDIRSLWDGWFAGLPEFARRDVGSRMRSGDDAQFQGATWELYVHELFRLSGYSVEIHPESTMGRTRPDFLVRRDESELYVECLAILRSRSESIAAKRSARLIEVLNAVDAPSFWLEVDIDTWGSGTPPVRTVRTDVERWLATLDPAAVQERLDAGGVRAAPELTLALDDWRVTIRPIPRRSNADRFGAIGIFPSFESGSRGGALRRRLREKMAGLPTDRPSIVAVMLQEPFVDRDGLRGQLASALAPHSAAPDDVRASVASRVSGILAVADFHPWSVTRRVPVVWQFGDALATLRLPIASMVRVDDPGEIEIARIPDAPVAPPFFFGLPLDWPGVPFQDDVASMAAR